ncbi:MAG: membrane protein insertase YidC [Alphaproteobacteria bacterium]|nr:membrane protein insertase YidC [Alphaproteobacteria bacterium]
MNQDNRNIILAVVLSAIVLFGWEYFVGRPQMNAQQTKQAELAKQEKTATPAGPAAAPNLPAATPATMSREQALKNSGARVTIDTPTVDGSLLLKGARFDDLRLKKYRETLDPKSPEIVLFAPDSTQYPYYAISGWLAEQNAGVKTPDNDTVWSLKSGKVLSPGNPVTLEWNNGQGLTFTRIITIDDKYMFTIADAVTNASGKQVTLYPYASVVRKGIPKEQHYWVLHEGFVGVVDGSAKYTKYDAMKPEEEPQHFTSTGGWLGITDKYWMAVAIPNQNEQFTGEYKVTGTEAHTNYQADYSLAPRKVAPGKTVSVNHRLFAGAKIVSVLRGYENADKIDKFDLAIDWGWFWFLTKPIFLGIDWFYKLVGNFGVAILLLTVLIKLAFFPLADASYRSMGKMKKVQPEMERIRERFADDKMRQQQEMMELYKREKVNPVGGCLPMLLQIPVFFSLYKVLFVTIEMRHAPFFGWIHDLSAPDPTTIMNLFGLIPYDPHHILPAFVNIGIWPILMGFTQWVTMKLNPAPTDPVQARMFAFMPLIFTFMMATFPSGLIIYWTWNNILTGLQQYAMMKRQGVEVHLFKNLKLPAFLGGGSSEK